MPLTFPNSAPNTDRAEYPRVPTLTPALRVAADPARGDDELMKTQQEENYGDSWAYGTHTDPQHGWMHPPILGLNSNTTDDGPQPTEPPTLPKSASHAPRITSVD